MVRLFRIFIPLSVVLLLLSEVLLVTAALLAGAWLNPDMDPYVYLQGNGPVNIALVLISIVLGLYLQDLYTDIYVRSHLLLVQQLCIVMGSACMVQAVVNYIDPDLRMPLHILAPGAAIAMVGIYGWRVFFSTYVVKRVGRDRLLLVGNSPLLADVAEHIHTHPEMGVRVIGLVNDDPDDPAAPRQAKCLGPLDALREI